jgi:uncharacterized protein with HEPN domain
MQISNEINQACNKITNKILEAATKNIPNKVITSRPNDPPWRHNAVRRAIRQCKRLHSKAKKSQSSVDWANYRKARNECINKVRNAKQTYYLKLANQLKSNNLSQKEWWSLLKKVTN